MTAPEITVVSSPACHYCADAYAALGELAEEFLFDVRSIEAASDEGRAIVSTHRPSMFPLVLVDGALFSVGRLPRGKIRRVLQRAAA